MMSSKDDSPPMFTVIGFYPDTLQRFCSHIRATNVVAAERDIRVQYPNVAVCGVIAGEANCVDRERFVVLN